MTNPNQFFTRKHFLTIFLSGVIAAGVYFILSTIFLFPQDNFYYWIILAACSVTLSKRSAPLRQHVIFFFLILLLALIIPADTFAILQLRVVMVFIGGIIGLCCVRFIFPFRLEQEFRHGIIPILQVLTSYAESLVSYFQQLENNSPEQIEKNRAHLLSQQAAVEIALLRNGGLYPEWVYEVGFNPGLRSGLRFFLIRLEQMIETFFSMQYWLSNSIDHKLILEMRASMMTTLENNQLLLNQLIQFFLQAVSAKEAEKTIPDFTSDMTELENTLRRIVPASLELLDIADEYVALTALVHAMKDMRKFLLQLMGTLP